MISGRRTFCAVLLAVAASLAAGQTTAATQQASSRIVAVGDVHGSFEGLTAILRAAGLIDANHRWTGGTTTFVQTGDIYDRGTGVRQALDLLMRLEGEARRAGGRVIPLFGNHEIVNIVGDYRDVSPEMFAAFADGRSEARRTGAYAEIARLAKRRGQEPPARDAWMTAHPLGYIEYSAAVGPRGKYGRWIRGHRAAAVVDGNAFMHAGINHTYQGSIDDLNRAIAADIAAWDSTKDMMVRAGLIPAFANIDETTAAAAAEISRLNALLPSQKPAAAAATRQQIARLQRTVDIQKSALLDMEGPMWFRGFALWKDVDEAPFKALLTRLGLTRFVAGHTPMPQDPTLRTVRHRWNHTIFQIDTGMLDGTFFPGGRPSALEIAGDRITIIYTDGREVVVPGSGG